MLKNVDWFEYGGAGIMAVAGDYVASGKLPVLQSVANLDYYFDGAVVLADLLLSDRLAGGVGSALDGAAVFAAGDLIGKVLKNVINGATSSSSTTGTGASVDYVMAPAAPRTLAPATGSVSFSQEW